MNCGFELNGKPLIHFSQQTVLASLVHLGHKYVALPTTELWFTLMSQVHSILKLTKKLQTAHHMCNVKWSQSLNNNNKNQDI